MILNDLFMIFYKEYLLLDISWPILLNIDLKLKLRFILKADQAL